MTKLYFLHIPKTAGSSMTRLLEDSWPAGALAPHTFVEDLRDGPDELEPYAVVAGHLGTVAATDDRQVVTLLRDPVRRAWSHYKAYVSIGASFTSFRELLDAPVEGWIARDYHARWLAIPPGRARAPLSNAGLPPGAPGREEGVAVELADEELEARARDTLRRCALVGTVERIDEFVEALARLVGRPFPNLPRLNVGDGADDVTPEDAARVRAQSRIDARLVELANELLDRALDTLPELSPPSEPVVPLPYRRTMREAFYGTGWHGRVETPGAGWHRWTGPGVRSELRLPVRAGGAARVDVAVASACDRDALRSLRVCVQGRPVERRFEKRRLGVAVVCDVELDPSRPLTLELEVSHTRPMVNAVTGELGREPVGLDVGDIALEPLPP
jgi:hypothetical protein